ncbi:MAG: germination protein YpeB [bacterium]|jgi:spore germination protein
MAKNRLLPLGLALVLLLGGAWWGWRTTNRVNAMENALEASYQRAYFDLMENMENLDSLLGKSLASGAEGQRIMLLTSAWHQAENARSNMGNMPLGMINMMRSQQYLAQLGDYCYVLAEKIARGRGITPEEWQQLTQLHEQTREIHTGMREMMAGIREQGFQWSSLANKSRTRRLTPEAQQIIDGFGKFDERLRDQVPTLTYDGPFSDHVEEQEPKGLSGENITEAQAREKALEFLGVDGQTGYRIDKIGKTRGHIPAYSIMLTREEEETQVTVDISQQGGHVIYMVDSRVPEAGNISLSQAIMKAEEFLAEKGLDTMVPTGSIKEGNQFSISFAYQQDGVVIYPDLVKVTIAQDNGEVVAYNALGFLTSHQERELPEPRLTAQEAEARVAEGMDIQRTRLAVIPMSNLEEKFCYEVRGRLNDSTYLVYINALTGDEEQILQLVETEDGVRAM